MTSKDIEYAHRKGCRILPVTIAVELPGPPKPNKNNDLVLRTPSSPPPNINSLQGIVANLFTPSLALWGRENG